MSWIKGYQIKFDCPVNQPCLPRSVFSDFERKNIAEAVHSLMSIGAVSECESSPDQYVSRVFTVPKPNGKTRFILNLKGLNKFINTQHFKLEDIRTALKLISKDCYVATLDLKDAYFLIKVHPNSRKYLRFFFNDKLYEFNVVPFGLCTSPFIFTKLMKPVVKLLRACGYLSSVYLDDFFLTGYTYQECLQNIEITRKLLESLGFIINYEKSILIPSQSCKYLGYVVDTHKWQLSLPAEKRARIKDELVKIKKLKRCKIRQFAQLIGLLVSACPAIEYGLLYTKELERCKFLNLKDNDNYDKYMSLPSNLLPDINWWLGAIDHSVHRIRDDNFILEIYSDASTTGWGAACGEQTASGQWSHTEKLLHINQLELIAAFFALKIFAKDYSNCQILLRIDNTTAVSYINRMGGVQYPHLTRVTKDIWQWCESRKILVVASYIKSQDNSTADRESRRTHPDVEWELSHSGFEKILKHLLTPEIDLFANRINKKCDIFVSWHRDPEAFAIDAFTLDWSNHLFYAFPPVAVILKCLRKIISDKAQGIMVIPRWPSQPWYPLFMRLLSSDLVELNSEDVFIPDSSNRNIQASTTLVAGILSGRRCLNV